MNKMVQDLKDRRLNVMVTCGKCGWTMADFEIKKLSENRIDIIYDCVCGNSVVVHRFYD